MYKFSDEATSMNTCNTLQWSLWTDTTYCAMGERGYMENKCTNKSEFTVLMAKKQIIWQNTDIRHVIMLRAQGLIFYTKKTHTQKQVALMCFFPVWLISKMLRVIYNVSIFRPNVHWSEVSRQTFLLTQNPSTISTGTIVSFLLTQYSVPSPQRPYCRTLLSLSRLRTQKAVKDQLCNFMSADRRHIGM